MADNLTVTQGTGTTIAADDIAGVLHQRVKLSLGADGVANDASAGSGVVGTGTQRVVLATDVALPAGETHLGQVSTHTALLDATLTLDTSAYADGDLLADTQGITSAFRVADGTGVIESIMVLDEDDQGTAMDLIFMGSSATLGTENSAPSVSDANARDILGRVRIDAADFVDLGGCRVATRLGVGLVVKAASGTTTLYIGAVTRGGTPTYTASGVRVRIGLLQD